MISADLSGIASRFFVMGFFVPAAGAIGLLSIGLSDNMQPAAYAEASATARVFAGAALALFVGLVLLGLRRAVIRLFEGYPFLAQSALRPIGNLLRRLQEREFDRLVGLIENDAESAAGRLARIELDLNYSALRADGFEAARKRLLPTRFGNAFRAAEDYASSRWGFSGPIVGRLVDSILSERERELHIEAKSDVHFYLNSVLGGFFCAFLLSFDVFLGNKPLLFLLVPVAALGIAYFFYLFAVRAAIELGIERRTSFDLHHLDVYDLLGVRRPNSREEQQAFAVAINRFLALGDALPDEMRLMYGRDRAT